MQHTCATLSVAKTTQRGISCLSFSVISLYIPISPLKAMTWRAFVGFISSGDAVSVTSKHGNLNTEGHRHLTVIVDKYGRAIPWRVRVCSTLTTNTQKTYELISTEGTWL